MYDVPELLPIEILEDEEPEVETWKRLSEVLPAAWEIFLRGDVK